MQAVPPTPTEFELYAQRLGLTKKTYTASARLRAWCEGNKNRFYIPEWLLAEWNIAVDGDAGVVSTPTTNRNKWA